MNKCFNFPYLVTLIYHNLEEFVLEDKEICEQKNNVNSNFFTLSFGRLTPHLVTKMLLIFNDDSRVSGSI